MRLIDCYMDAIGYTLYLLRGSEQGGQSFDRAREDIEGILNKAGEAARSGGFSTDDTIDAKFAICAWIDEKVLTSSWEGMPEWRKNQLQREFFNTNNAGVEFFERLERLDDNRKPVLEVYTLCLSLGFHGRFFREDELPELENIRQSNIKKLLGDLADETDLAGIKLFPEAYLSGKSAKSKAIFRPFDWVSLLIPVVAAAIAIELFLFYRNSLNIDLLQFFGAMN